MGKIIFLIYGLFFLNSVAYSKTLISFETGSVAVNKVSRQEVKKNQESIKITEYLTDSSQWPDYGSAEGKGFVIHVSPSFIYGGKSTKIIEKNLPIFFQPNMTEYKAIYVLTNYHVWFNDKQAAQKMLRNRNNNSMLVTKIKLFHKTYNKSYWENYIFDVDYFSNTVENLTTGKKEIFSMSKENMGVQEIASCLEDMSNFKVLPGIMASHGSGCDFVLLRMIVPTNIKVVPFKISSSLEVANRQVYVPLSGGTFGSHRIIKNLGEADRIILSNGHGPENGWSGSPLVRTVDGEADRIILSNGHGPENGWSGSPLVRTVDDVAIGLAYSAWPGHNSLLLSHDLYYLFSSDYLDLSSFIMKDQSNLIFRSPKSHPPYRFSP